MDNEVIIIHITGLVDKMIVFEPKSRVCLPRVLWDIGRWSVPWRECSIDDVSAKGQRTHQAKARALVLTAVVASAMMRMIATAGSFSWVAIGMSTGVEGAACVVVVAET